MKIVIVHGQNHKGSTYHIGKMIADKIETEENIVEFFLPKDLNHFCIGCCACIEDEHKCPFYEEKNKIMQNIEEADLLIFTSPTYCLNASAALKSFFELTFTYWMPHRPKQCMFHKKAIIVSAAAGTGTKKVIKSIQQTLSYWGISHILTYGISVQAMNWNGVSETKKQKIDKDTTKMAQTILKNKPVKTSLKVKALFMMMRMMQKSNMGSGLAEREYWQKNGWLESSRPWI